MNRSYCGLVGVVLLWPFLTAAGCLEDADCSAGARCLLARGYLEGRCASALPLISVPTDAGRLSISVGQRGNTGSSCQFNVDCLPGLACYKAGRATIEGQCLQP